MRGIPKRARAWIARHIILVLVLVLLVLSMNGEGATPGDIEAQIYRCLTGLRFKFVEWELDALGGKLAHSLVAPQRYMNEETRHEFFVDYLQFVAQVQRLDQEINRTYADPDIEDPGAVTAELRAQLAELRRMENDRQLIAEAILEEQVSS
ncbi:MAG: hypothetical protein MUQ10_18570, partial [Anaerolineae bacterium]|nr:hypothetical protein [Anaerolineae bacterium]